MMTLIGRLTRMKVVENRFKTCSWLHSFKDFCFFMIYGYYYDLNLDCEEGRENKIVRLWQSRPGRKKSVKNLFYSLPKNK